MTPKTYLRMLTDSTGRGIFLILVGALAVIFGVGGVWRAATTQDVMAEKPPVATAQPSQREDCDWMYAKAKTAALREDINCSNCGNAKQSRMWSKLYLTCVERQNLLFPQDRVPVLSIR